MINKVILTFKSIRNLHMPILDFLGLLKGRIIYKLRNGIYDKGRTGSKDYA